VSIEGFRRVRGFAAALGGGCYPTSMLLASTFGLAFILLLALLMHLPTKALAGLFPLPPLSINLLFGLSTLVATLWVTFLFNLTIHKSLLVWVVVLALINLGSILYLKMQKNLEPIRYGFSVRDFILVSAASALSIFPQTGLSISANLRSRVGPDMIGWVSSGQYLYNHATLETLKDSIKTGLGISDISNIFLDSQKVSQQHVYNLLSFTNQVQAEFLIGAKRVIGPRIFSAAMVLFGQYNIPIVVLTVSFIFIAIGLVFVIDNLGYIKKFTLNEFPSIILFVLIACNFAFLNPVNEGGLGQLFVFPSLCLLISAYLKKVFVLESIIIYLLSSRLLYPEGGSQMLVMLGIILLFEIVPSKLREKSIRSRSYLISLMFIILLVIGTYVSEIFSLSKTLSRGAGGWGIGEFISPLNYGLINYVNEDGKTSPNSSIATVLFLCTISFFAVVARKNLQLRPILLSREFKLFFGILLIWIFIFYLSWGTSNNYSVWKFAAFASVIIFITAFHKANSLVIKIKHNKLRLILFSLVLMITTSQTIDYHLKWFSGSGKLAHINMPKNDLIAVEKLLDKSVAIKFGEFGHTNTIALLGNLRWPERGANIVLPSSELLRLLVIDAKFCRAYESAKEVLLVTKELCFLDAASPSIKL
jgi:hypothetical protein